MFFFFFFWPHSPSVKGKKGTRRERKQRQQSGLILESGKAERGWRYVEIDVDCVWEVREKVTFNNRSVRMVMIE